MSDDYSELAEVLALAGEHRAGGRAPTGFVCLSLCLFVCLSIIIYWTARDITTNFSGHHPMVERTDKFENGYGVRGWWFKVSDVLVLACGWLITESRWLEESVNCGRSFSSSVERKFEEGYRKKIVSKLNFLEQERPTIFTEQGSP